MRLTGSKSIASTCAALLLVGAMAAGAADHALLIGGLGGEEKYAREFADCLSKFRSALIEGEYSSGTIRLLAESKGGPSGADEVSTLENIGKALARLSKELSSSDTLLLVLVGHGQSDYREAKLNLPGPDLAARELARMLHGLPTREQRLILSFPCSGHFSELIARKGRIVIASTDGPRQVYRSAMTEFLAPTLRERSADLDRDGAIDYYELFEFLSKEVDDYFETHGRLQADNVSLEDNGDGKVTTLAEGMDAGDGDLARRAIIIPAR